MRPCDCTQIADMPKLKEQGISHNDRSISLSPASVVLRMDHTTIKIPQHLFKLFAEWYLADQSFEDFGKGC